MPYENKGLSRRAIGQATLFGTAYMSLLHKNSSTAHANVSPPTRMKRGYADGPYGQVRHAFWQSYARSCGRYSRKQLDRRRNTGDLVSGTQTVFT